VVGNTTHNGKRDFINTQATNPEAKEQYRAYQITQEF